MTDLLEAPPEALWHVGYRSCREHRHVNIWNLNWYCRHARQAMDAVKQWTVPEFRSNLGVLQGILEKEWETPGE